MKGKTGPADWYADRLPSLFYELMQNALKELSDPGETLSAGFCLLT